MKAGLTRDQIAARIATELHEGEYVNLGMGLPVLVPKFVPEGLDVVFHAENGMLGYSALEDSGLADPDLINAGNQPVGTVAGTSFFHSADAFAMIRGGHIDTTILGGLQVSEAGDLANWTIPGRVLGGMGGAMDLVAGARRVIVAMEHVAKNGAPKILRKCTYPLTGVGVVDLVVTDLAVIEVTREGLVLREVAAGWTAQEIQERTEAPLIVVGDLREIAVGSPMPT